MVGSQHNTSVNISEGGPNCEKARGEANLRITNYVGIFGLSLCYHSLSDFDRSIGPRRFDLPPSTGPSTGLLALANSIGAQWAHLLRTARLTTTILLSSSLTTITLPTLSPSFHLVPSSSFFTLTLKILHPFFSSSLCHKGIYAQYVLSLSHVAS